MGKSDGLPLKDVTIKKSNESLTTGQSSKATNEDDMCKLDLNLPGYNSADRDNKDIVRRGKFKIEPVTLTAFKNTRRPKLEPGFKKPSWSSSWNYESASRLALSDSKIKTEPGSKIKTEPGRSLGLRFRQQPAAHSAAPESSSSRGSELIVMGCLNCYMYVMVCNNKPQCPNCRKGDRLLDPFRAKTSIDL